VPYFSSDAVPSSLGHNTNIYYNRDGELEKGIYIPADKFVASLSSILIGRGTVSFALLLKAVFAAYHNAIGKKYTPGQQYRIFFETHKVGCNTYELDGMFKSGDFKRIEHLIIIWEPVQHIFPLCSGTTNHL